MTKNLPVLSRLWKQLSLKWTDKNVGTSSPQIYYPLSYTVVFLKKHFLCDMPNTQYGKSWAERWKTSPDPLASNVNFAETEVCLWTDDSFMYDSHECFWAGPEKVSGALRKVSRHAVWFFLSDFFYIRSAQFIELTIVQYGHHHHNSVGRSKNTKKHNSTSLMNLTR